ncbi:hypothetical protein AGMMS50276_03080 [Synergistales bacterium]|nr:hypothetical protein AGMMS50276_03080 [Synergistales bacterium]
MVCSSAPDAANVIASNSGTGANSGGMASGGKTTISTITDQGRGTNPYPPTMSGADTVVIVNGQIIFGKPVTPDNPDYDDKRRSSGGCDAGVGVFALALLPLACMGMKRKEK